MVAIELTALKTRRGSIIAQSPTDKTVCQFSCVTILIKIFYECSACSAQTLARICKAKASYPPIDYAVCLNLVVFVFHDVFASKGVPESLTLGNPIQNF